MALFLLWSIPFIGLLFALYFAAYYSIYLRKSRKKKHQRKKGLAARKESATPDHFQVTDTSAQQS